MLRYVLNRLWHAFFSLVAMSLIVFGTVRLTGDPLQALLPVDASPQMYDDMRAQLGLDQPLPLQFIRFLTDIASGDFGISYRTRGPVTELIASRFPATLQLGLAAIVLTVVAGILLGVCAAYWHGRWPDRLARLVAVLGQSAPPFFVGMTLVLVFAVRLGWLPPGGNTGIVSLILPATTLALFTTAGVARLLRSSLIETMSADYVTFLRVKGVSERRILWKHGLRNASLPALTFGGILVGSLMTGAVTTEIVFVWPGMGQLLLQSVQARDFPVVQAVVVILSAVYILVSLAVDLLYGFLNPRLRKG